MAMVELKLNALSADEVRKVAAALSRNQPDIPTHNHNGTIAPHWAPIVHCEGPSLFTLYTPKVARSVAADVLSAIAPR